MLGLRPLSLFILGDVLGAGIHALVGTVAAETGGAIWTAFTVALVLAVCTAFSYLLVTLTASMVVPTATLAGSDGALLEVVRAGPLGVPEKLFSAIALLAVATER